MTRVPQVGYYVHHQGRGHLHRALALTGELRGRGLGVTVLSSLERPDGPEAADVRWVRLPRDDEGTPVEPAPGGVLHWAPRHHAGLRRRTARLSRWIDEEQPDLVVSDVSQEVSLLCRLHGVPVVSVVLPGDRGDTAHRLGLGVSDRLVGFWPPAATRMVSGLDPTLRDRLTPVGALSRFPPVPAARVEPSSRRLLVLSGQGGDGWTEREVAGLVVTAPRWEVEALGTGRWSADPWPRLEAADVVLTRAGQSSVAEVAASRTPAVVVPAPRPHDEQAHTAAQLAQGPWPVVVAGPLPLADVQQTLDAAARLDGDAWSTWCDGGAAGRFADVVEAVVAGDRPLAGAAR